MKKIVVVGGGTGTFTVLRGLKQYPLDITAVVTTFDSGGSTGLLRDEFGTLPSGDIRRCLIALAPDNNGENTLRDLFMYRFDTDSSLKGHSFGNLFLQALTDVTGDEVSAIQKATKLLGCKGRVLPVSTQHAHLCAILSDGTTIRGETNIDIPKHDGEIPIKQVYLDPPPKIYAEAAVALREADCIVIGPGDLYTSIIPNVLVEGFREAIRSRKGKLIYVLNLMTKWGETNNYTASDFGKALLKYLEQKKFDYLVYSTTPLEQKLVKAYAAEKSYPVLFDTSEVHALTRDVVMGDFTQQGNIVRHDSHTLAKALVSL